jgi:hypothetical protein
MKSDNGINLRFAAFATVSRYPRWVGFAPESGRHPTANFGEFAINQLGTWSQG